MDRLNDLVVKNQEGSNIASSLKISFTKVLSLDRTHGPGCARYRPECDDHYYCPRDDCVYDDCEQYESL